MAVNHVEWRWIWTGNLDARFSGWQLSHWPSLAAACTPLARNAQPTPAPAAPPDLQPAVAPTVIAVPSATTAPAATPEPQWGAAPPIHVTSNDDFYDLAISQQTSYFAVKPYRLEISGAVGRAFSLTMDEIRALPVVEQMRTLECIGNPVGGPLIGNAVWRGIRLADLLRQASPASSAIEVKIASADGFSTSVPVALAMHPDSLLVYDMNGVPLPEKHGAPLRVLLPGRYGMKQPKWVTSIEVITEPYLGTYERAGWTNDASVRPNTQIRTPRESEVVADATYALSGTAFAGDVGIRSIDVSLDSGRTWLPARLVKGPSALNVDRMAPRMGRAAGGTVHRACPRHRRRRR